MKLKEDILFSFIVFVIIGNFIYWCFDEWVKLNLFCIDIFFYFLLRGFILIVILIEVMLSYVIFFF